MACYNIGSRRPTIRDLSSTAAAAATVCTPQQPRPSPAAWFLYEGGDAAGVSSGHHFLDECRMCGRYLPRSRDVYMYKGNTPYCSEDCRDEQIRIDEHEERASRRRGAKAAAAGSSSVSAQVKTRAAAVAVGVV